eukprot:1446281-Alexandrium_andersonii.AAC.1
MCTTGARGPSGPVLLPLRRAWRPSPPPPPQLTAGCGAMQRESQEPNPPGSRGSKRTGDLRVR